jgi:hypothetical protein
MAGSPLLQFLNHCDESTPKLSKKSVKKLDALKKCYQSKSIFFVPKKFVKVANHTEYWNYSGIGYPGIIPELLFWNYYGFGYSRISTITWRRGAAAYTNSRIAIPE